jgi:hypothetical protein
LKGHGCSRAVQSDEIVPALQAAEKGLILAFVKGEIPLGLNGTKLLIDTAI